MDNLKKIDAFLNETGVCFFSTTDSLKPHVRPIGFHLLRGDRIYFVISNHKEMYGQLQNNPFVEIAACKDQNWMRYSGRAVFEADDSVISAMVNSVPELREKFGGDKKEQLAILHLEDAVCEFRRMTLLTDRFELNMSKQYEKEHLVNRWNMTHPEYLRELIREGHFEIYYQPQYDLKMRALCGAEALTRFVDDEGRIFEPADFIPELEEARVIGELDFFVFEHVCRRARERALENSAQIIVSSNFSKHTISEEHFVERLTDIADRNGVPRRLLAVEVTETTEADRRELFLRTIRRLHEKEFRIAIDDFGVMGANMRLLTEIDFHMLKVDKSVIDSVHTRRESRILISALIHACHQLGTRVLAEGVETEEQSQALLDIKCDAVQGYLFGKPLPEKEFEELLRGTAAVPREWLE